MQQIGVCSGRGALLGTTISIMADWSFSLADSFSRTIAAHDALLIAALQFLLCCDLIRFVPLRVAEAQAEAVSSCELGKKAEAVSCCELLCYFPLHRFF